MFWKKAMTVCDEQGKVLARIYILEEQSVDEEEAPGGAYEGAALSTAEVQEHLRQLCDSYVPIDRGSRVEWLPQALENLESIWRERNTPPSARHRAAVMKFIQEVVDLLDEKLTAWTTLTSKWRDRQYKLIKRPLAVLFRVYPDRSLVRVEHVRWKGWRTNRPRRGV